MTEILSESYDNSAAPDQLQAEYTEAYLSKKNSTDINVLASIGLLAIKFITTK